MFVSSDGAIMMDVPDGWMILESGEQTIIALGDDGTQVIMTYGEALSATIEAGMETFIAEGVTINDDEALTFAAFALAEAADIPPFVTRHTIRERDFARYVDVQADYDDYYYVTHTDATGLIQFALYGSVYPLADMLTLLYAFAPPPTVELADCTALTFSSDSAQPGAVVQIENLPVGLDDFHVQARSEHYEEAAPAPVFATAEGAVMIAPLYPDFRIEGGAVTLEIVYNGAVCHSLPFEILAVPPAPGELDRFIAAAQDMIDATGDFLGVGAIDPTDADLPEWLLPVAEVQFLISHRDNPESLDTLEATLEPDELAVIEAFLAHDGYVALMESRAAFIRQQPPLTANTPESTSVAAFQMVAHEMQSAQTPRPVDVFDRVNIPDGETLSEYMTLQGTMSRINDFTEAPLEVLGLINASTGAGGALAQRLNLVSRDNQFLGRAGKIGLAFSIVSISGSAVVDLYRYLLPSEFTLVYGTLTMPTMNEDDGTRHAVRDVRVHVRSQQWTLTKLMVDVSLTIASSVRAATDALLGPGAVVAGETREILSGTLSPYLDGAGDALAMGDFISALCGAFAADCDSDIVSAGPYEWRNISLNVEENEGEFIEFGLVPGLIAEPSIQTDDPIYYEAIDDGLSVVYVRPDPESFGGNSLTEWINVHVRPIAVSVRAPRYAEVGEMVCANASVANAHDISLEWRVLNRDGAEIERGYTGSDEYPPIYCFTVPETDESLVSGFDDYERCLRTERTAYILVAEAITDSGARQHNALQKPRRGTTSVWVADEDDICEGLWRTIALQELGDMCSSNPPINAPFVVNVSQMFQDMIEAGELDSVVQIDLLDQGERLLFTDPATGDQGIFNRISERTTTRDIGVHIIIDDPPASDGTISELIEVADGHYEIITAPPDSTVWADGHHYRYEVVFPIAPPLRQIQPMRVDMMFTSPESAILNHTWHVEAFIEAAGTTYHIECIMNILYVAELIQSN
ncbi:MAG: hypothetical protein EA396_08080 [Anaerolineaceae bacterium]|nr:MAG: hypothetical protein EA396_08080 [Anaerolineaceae bacterium]